MERRVRIETPLAPPSIGFRSQGLLAGGLLFGAGQVGAPLRAPGDLADLPDTLEEQVALALEHLAQVTRAADVALHRVVEVSAFLVPSGRVHDVRRQIETYLDMPVPLFHSEQVAAVALHGMLEMDWIAIQDPAMSSATVADILAPFFGGVERATRSGPFVMLTQVRGQGQTLGEQTRSALLNAHTILRQQGSAVHSITKMTAYIADYDSYPHFNDATKEVFHDTIPPARSVLVAPAIAEPSLLCLDLIALRDETTVAVRI
jgi:enamine deaminase RidA (YjgF/YER057c/UK114 family)